MYTFSMKRAFFSHHLYLWLGGALFTLGQQLNLCGFHWPEILNWLTCTNSSTEEDPLVEEEWFMLKKEKN